MPKWLSWWKVGALLAVVWSCNVLLGVRTHWADPDVVADRRDALIAAFMVSAIPSILIFGLSYVALQLRTDLNQRKARS